MPNPDSSMAWVKSFYEKQNLWSNVYAGDIEPWHRDKAKTILLPDRKPPYRILELGCGGGQTAVSLAELGHDVVAIDMNSDAILNARRLAAAQPSIRISLIEGDFYAFNPEGLFDVVCYFDGFGIGSDAAQQRLLHRVSSWLRTEGRAFIEIYTPWYWANVAGTVVEWPDASRRYDFDNDESRLLDTWWKTGSPDTAVTQSLRCYSPDDFEGLLDEASLRLISLLPGGSYDHGTQIYHPLAPLEEAMQYIAVLGSC
jgi:SAM-dependent methyltransferase